MTRLVGVTVEMAPWEKVDVDGRGEKDGRCIETSVEEVQGTAAGTAELSDAVVSAMGGPPVVAWGVDDSPPPIWFTAPAYTCIYKYVNVVKYVSP